MVKNNKDRAAQSTGNRQLKSTLIFSFFLFLLTIVLGIGTGLWAYSQGLKALKEVNMPDVNPTKKIVGKTGNTQKQKIHLLDEAKILKELTKNNNSNQKTQRPKTQENTSSTKKEKDKQVATEPQESGKFPLTTSKNDVILEVEKITQDGNSLVMKVSLKNESSSPVRFLYSFLDVRDEQDRVLTALTDGLPSELPANGEAFSGTIRIPSAMLNEVTNLSLTLPDYPEQNIELKLNNIPVGN
jgi:hypothetical protein